MKSKLNTILVLALLTVVVSCASYKGDGKLETTTNWLLFYPVHAHSITFDSFDFSQETISYNFENLCSDNNGFKLYLHLTAPERMDWWIDPSRAYVVMKDKEGATIFQDSFEFNNIKQYAFHGEDYSVESFQNVRRHIPSKDLLLGLSVRHRLGCERYSLTLRLERPRSAVRVSGQLKLVSSWK